MLTNIIIQRGGKSKEFGRIRLDILETPMDGNKFSISAFVGHIWNKPGSNSDQPGLFFFMR